MATTAKGIVPDTKAKGQKRRKPMSKQHKAKLVAALANWRASLTDEDRAEQAERSRQQHKARWEGMTKKERDAASGHRGQREPSPGADPKGGGEVTVATRAGFELDAAIESYRRNQRTRLAAGILQIVGRRRRQAGIPGLHPHRFRHTDSATPIPPHRFRHTFAHSMLVRGGTEGAVAALAGWKDHAMLARYGRSAAVERAVAEFRRLDAHG